MTREQIKKELENMKKSAFWDIIRLVELSREIRKSRREDRIDTTDALQALDHYRLLLEDALQKLK